MIFSWRRKVGRASLRYAEPHFATAAFRLTHETTRRARCLRVVLAFGVFIALPISHMYWGALYPGDGQQASGFIMIFAVIGIMAAVLFAALGSLVQFLLRKRSPRLTVLVDLGLFLAFAGILVYGGVTAEYGDTSPKAPPASSRSMPGLRPH